MTKETLELLRELLDQVQIPVGHQDFEQQALAFITAKREVASALAAAPGEPSLE